MSKFNVGDKVFNLGHGVGTVTEVDRNDNTLLVDYGDGDEEWFYQDGKEYNNSYAKYPTLFTREEAKQKFPEYLPKEKVKVTAYLHMFTDNTKYVTSTDCIPAVGGVDWVRTVELTGEYELP